MNEDRIATTVTLQAKNGKGEVTIDATVTVYDQSHEQASAMLLSVLDGISAPARAQVE